MEPQKQQGTILENDVLSNKIQSFNWQKWLGVAACAVIIAACFMHWAYYPDIQKHFTGFDTKVFFRGKMVNYYGRPGILLTVFAVLGIFCHLMPRIWAKRANLFFAALCVAYAIKSYFMFSAEYSGFIPDKEAGLWLMLLGTAVNLVVAAVGKV